MKTTYVKKLRSFNSNCSNCGGSDRVSIRLIVPEEVGGTTTPSNTVVLCRPCDMAMDTVLLSGKSDNRRAINFWVNHDLNNSIQKLLKDKNGFKSMGALVRYLMNKYVENPERFDDISNYQSNGTDLKINIWVDSDIYSDFKSIVDAQGTTVTSVIKSLICLYATESESFFSENR